MRLKSTCVLYLLPDKLQLYVDSLTDIFEYHFHPDIIRDLTIVRRDLFEQDIAKFILDHNIPASNILMVIADKTSHIQKLKQDESEDEQKKAFQMTIPFPHVAQKTITTPDGQYLYATNEELCFAIKTAFEKQNFGVDFVLPALVFGDEFSSKDELSYKDIAAVLKQAFMKEQYDLIPTKMVPDERELDAVVEHETNKDIMRLYAAASLFGVLTIAIAVAWNIYNPYPSQTYRGQAEDTKRYIIMPAAQETNDLEVQVRHTSASSPLAEELRTSLGKYKFKTLSLLRENQKTVTTATIIFGQKASPLVRGALLAEVQRYAPEITVRDDAETEFDIIIILP